MSGIGAVRSTAARCVIGGLGALVAVAALAGCAPEDADASPSPNASASASSTPSPSDAGPGSASPSASATAVGGTPIDADCTDLVSLQTMYDFDPNFGLDDSYSPAAGTPAATAVADSGVACGWLQQTSGETIVISAAEPGDLTSLRSAAGVTGDGSSFAADGDVGTVQVFSGPYWVTLTSTYFTSVGDAQPLIDSVLDGLD